MHKTFLPMNLQLFANDPAGGATQQGTGAQAQPQNQNQPTFDYEKLAGLIQGKQSVAEDTVLKNYFQQQGLSKEEMNQAISAFKQQKAASQPDLAGLQNQLATAQQATQTAQAATLKAQLESAATLAAVGLGIDAKSIPYILKMADFGAAMGQDGKINADAVTGALNKVLEDIPALKPQGAAATGFVQVGASGNQGQQATNTESELDRIFGVKKK